MYYKEINLICLLVGLFLCSFFFSWCFFSISISIIILAKRHFNFLLPRWIAKLTLAKVGIRFSFQQDLINSISAWCFCPCFFLTNLKVLFQAYSYNKKNNQKRKHCLKKKIPKDLKPVKLIFRLYFPKDIFKVFINLQKKWKNVQIMKIVGYKTICYNTIKQLNL